MEITNSANYFIGTITDVYEGEINGENVTAEFQYIKANIPGVIDEVIAFPTRDQIDEPRIGDQVLLISLDPVYNSYFIYRKLKENNFIGFRAAGKMVDITPDSITIGVFDKETEYSDSDRPETSISSVIMDKDGNITIHASGNSKITIDGDASLEVSGTTDIKSTGNCNIKSSGTVNINGTPKVVINGGNNGGIVNQKSLNALLNAIIMDIPTRMNATSLPLFNAIRDLSLYDNNATH